MFKKYLLTAAVSLSLLTGYAAPSAEQQLQEAPASEQTLPDGQIVMETSEPDSKEVATVEESAIAHKMTQAEKAENAKENDSWGGAITIVAMCIVLAALIILCVLFMGFGKISSRLLSKKKREAKGASASDSDDHDVDSGDVIAAIGMALAEHFDGKHDMEDTILTIQRMKKAYSPWNSKIYNLRETPVLKRNNLGKTAFTKR